MPASRRLTALFAAACLAGASFGTSGALAQNAGDEQYQDPLSTQTSSPAPTTPTTAPDPAQIPQLAPSAGGEDPATEGSTSTTPQTPKAPTQADAKSLPNTGVDGRVLAGLGFGLLLCGVGLRLRTARERF